MAANCTNALAEIKTDAMMIVIYYNRATTHIDDAQTHYDLNQDHAAIEDLILASRDINMAASSFGGWGDYPYEGAIWWYLKNCITEYELTWQAICEAWVKNDFEGRDWTIAIIDRMRQILWDEPFNVQWAAKATQESG